MTLAGRAALVTGSSSGIGAAIAVRLAEEGADIVVHYRDHEDGAKETLKRVEAAGRRGCIVRADLARLPDMRRLVAKAFDFAPLDILANNAGLEMPGPFIDVTEQDYDQVLDVSLKGVFFTTQGFAKKLIAARRPGRVINISSVHEDLPFPGLASYCASKGGLKMLSRDLAIELAPSRITVNSIAPGAIETPINAKFMKNRKKLKALLAKIPLRRIGQPGEIAGAVAFLASEDAAYITGETLLIDVGLTWNYREQ